MRGELFLVDTSIWLDVLPRSSVRPALSEGISELLLADEVATMGMVLLELLSGARTRKEWERLRDLLGALHRLLVADGDWEEAAGMGFERRRQGLSVPSTDLLIGAVAIRAGASVVHRDHHFDFIAARFPLQVESYVAA